MANSRQSVNVAVDPELYANAKANGISFKEALELGLRHFLPREKDSEEELYQEWDTLLKRIEEDQSRIGKLTGQLQLTRNQLRMSFGVLRDCIDNPEDFGSQIAQQVKRLSVYGIIIPQHKLEALFRKWQSGQDVLPSEAKFESLIETLQNGAINAKEGELFLEKRGDEQKRA